MDDNMLLGDICSNLDISDTLLDSNPPGSLPLSLSSFATIEPSVSTPSNSSIPCSNVPIPPNFPTSLTSKQLDSDEITYVPIWVPVKKTSTVPTVNSPFILGLGLNTVATLNLLNFVPSESSVSSTSMPSAISSTSDPSPSIVDTNKMWTYVAPFWMPPAFTFDDA